MMYFRGRGLHLLNSQGIHANLIRVFISLSWVDVSHDVQLKQPTEVAQRCIRSRPEGSVSLKFSWLSCACVTNPTLLAWWSEWRVSAGLLAEGQDNSDLAAGFVFPNFPQSSLDTHTQLVQSSRTHVNARRSQSSLCSCVYTSLCPESHSLIQWHSKSTQTHVPAPTPSGLLSPAPSLLPLSITLWLLRQISRLAGINNTVVSTTHLSLRVPSDRINFVRILEKANALVMTRELCCLSLGF